MVVADGAVGDREGHAFILNTSAGGRPARGSRVVKNGGVQDRYRAAATVQDPSAIRGGCISSDGGILDRDLASIKTGDAATVRCTYVALNGRILDDECRGSAPAAGRIIT